jgi:hypothetical protein
MFTDNFKNCVKNTVVINKWAKLSTNTCISLAVTCVGGIYV